MEKKGKIQENYSDKKEIILTINSLKDRIKTKEQKKYFKILDYHS